jgi:hypothetical protein
MNRYILTSIFIFVCFCFIICNVSYSCVPVGIDIYYDWYVVPVGDSVYVWTDVYSGAVDDWDWDYDWLNVYVDYNAPDGYGMYVGSDYAGTYAPEVEAYSSGSSDYDYCYVYVSEVDEIVNENYETGTQYVPVGGQINLYANSYPDNGQSYPYDEYYFPYGEPTWSITSKPSGSNQGLSTWDSGKCVGGGEDALTLSNLTVAGDYVVKAVCGYYDSGNTITVTVVKVDHLEYNDPDNSWTAVSETGTFYVYQGTTVNFKAVPNPSVSPFPAVWSGAASGTGSTTSVTFNTRSTSTTDYKYVTATYGNNKTIKVIVYALDGILTPDDIFTGRDLYKYGLKELVYLQYTTDPVGITGLPLQWTRTAGNGSILPGDIYYAGDQDGNVTLKLRVTSGPSKDYGATYGRTIVAPSGTRMTRVNPNKVYHEYNTASAGIRLYWWLDPTYVSFNNLTFGERTCLATNASGVFANQGQHPENGPYTISGGNITTGCRVTNEDHTWVRYVPWNGGDGAFTWNIPTQYFDGSGTRHPFGSTLTHISQVWANGNATQTKAGYSGSAAASDPNKNWP